MPSVAIMICFASPSEQHFWRCPKSLLSCGIDARPSVPINAGILHGHMLCAGDEYPLVGDEPVTALLRNGLAVDESSGDDWLLSDKQLFGEYYHEVLSKLKESGLIRVSKVTQGVGRSEVQIDASSTHPSVGKPWHRVSMRSIEPIAYSIVDLSHSLQGGRTDIVNERAVMDTIPYSRVFYHAHPGAVIKHRGRSYKIISMNSPPPFADCTIGYNRQSCTLGAFAKPTNASYSTRPLSLMHITVVKQFDRVELVPDCPNAKAKCAGTKSIQTDSSSTKNSNEDELKKGNGDDVLIRFPEKNFGSIAGNGVVTVKRTVHGYKKLSPVNRTELSRHELKMPSMEYDTNGIWFDVEANLLTPVMNDFDSGVHALSHALCAVAPLFVPCTSSDLDCDHSRRECTRVLLFDVRAGGAGTVSRLWKHFFRPNGIVSAAIELLKYCSTCSDDTGFKGGCPSCLQSCPCINFHEDLSRTAGLNIARRLLVRLEKTDLYRTSALLEENDEKKPFVMKRGREQETPDQSSVKQEELDTSRRLARKRALRHAQDLESAKKRSIVIGRPTWPADERL
uniref:MrfA-like Zn-binding domain-containing protein n=1 Tax=Odontella aurita TaxID=265563 RepID=A0A7S4K1G3_9STRA